MKQETTVYCLASGLERSCLAPREQSGMPDLGKGKEGSKIKKGMDKIICVLESHFKTGISHFYYRMCYKQLQEDVCLNLGVKAKALRRARAYQQ